jgi:hypothetical protein
MRSIIISEQRFAVALSKLGYLLRYWDEYGSDDKIATLSLIITYTYLGLNGNENWSKSNKWSDT